MKYMLVIFNNEQAWAALSEKEQTEMMNAHFAYSEDLRKKGRYVAGEALQPEATAKRVKLKNGKRTIQDGPFAEAKEVIGGFYLVDVPDREEAVEWGKRCPLIEGEYVEVRPVMTFG